MPTSLSPTKKKEKEKIELYMWDLMGMSRLRLLVGSMLRSHYASTVWFGLMLLVPS
jgi:hypothetical protein